MDISMDTLKMLRDKTGLSVMQCKKALEEANGDAAQAEVILRKRSSDAADKKSDRELGAGAVASYIHGGEIGAMVLLSCETDFVARNEEFPALAREIAMQVAATNPKYLHDTDIDDTARTAAMTVFTEEVKDKPEEMREKILEGKMQSYFKDMVLMNQPFIKDDSKTIQQLVDQASQKFGERVVISQFVRFSARG
ncbi:MAG: translation elongation factor Ts, elongation factor Ts [Parcubacteria group bacterium]|nr:translation elongation factor Ts, elongation factor Ts [Parcubacteria group bacterium]